ncbi:Ig-like domain-containing protein [Psychrobacter sanguinis]|uniref:Ig-like domain-containing protein n=2 Tax=Psychrobacter sanguinis TaxID=861445 RepID=UPI001E31846F|nr:Ig-like domain-containing protein [Psychrobacter sanguinis]MCD9151613.1 Ig-like domain-containing protein [Psychrobacter sanguinis]
MKTVIVKVNNATQTIAEHTVVTQDGKPTVIKAVQKVNYELLDLATGKAPQHIITKRVGKDLHVTVDDQGQESDLIIEGFYNDPDSALIGLAEDGSYYYYVPDSGELGDFVTELASGDIEGQALGGQAQPNPWWVGASDSDGGFAWLPWLAGLVGVAAIAAAAGGSSSSNDGPAKDTTPPNAPKVDNVTNIDTNGDGKPDNTIISGTTEPGAKVEIKDKDGNVIGSVVADDKGKFEIKVPALDKDEVVEVTATDKAGNESDPTEVIGTGDDIAPNAPTVDDVTNVDEDGDGTPDKTVITGKTEPGAEIIVKDKDGNVIGSTTADPEGNYEIEVPALDKDEVVDVTVKDEAGNESDPTEVVGTGDDIAPKAPTVDDVTNVDEDGDGTPDKTVITGKTEPGAEIIVKDKDGNVIGSTTADPEGNYEIEVPALDKDEVVDVTATDGAGNESDPTEVIGTGDDIAPNAPTVDDVTNVDEDGDGTPDKTVITGKTEPGAEIIVKDKDGNVIGSTTADPEGNYEIEVPALDKDEVVDVTATDGAGNESDPTEVIGTGDDIAPNAPTVDDVTNVDEDGDGTPDKTVITGKTEPGAEIIVKDKDGNVIGSTTADPEGNYEIEVPALDKDEVVDVTATDGAGNESDPTEVIGTGDDIAPNAPTVDDVTNVDEDGDGTPDKTVITGKTEPGAEVIVKDKDGNVIGSTTADPEGNYEIEVPALDKDEVVDVTATDGAGNESDPTEVIGTGDDIAPNAPTVDDVTNVDEDGDGTPDKTVITGKTEPGAEVIVKDKDGNVIGSTTADPEGNYEIEVPALDKDEVVDVTATDGAGNESDPTEVIGTGDDIAPNAPTVDDVTNVDEDGDGTPDKTVITGKTEPGAEIIVKDKDGNVIGSTTADPEGNYEIEVPALDKDEVVDVTATDKAGNESDPTEVIGTGDDIAPNAPTVDDVTNVDEDGDGTPDKTVITGKTEPGAEIIVKDKDGNVIGSTTADPEGNYEIEVPALDKDEVVDVTATDGAGNESDPTEVIGTGDDIAPNAPTVDDVTNVDEDGDGTPDKTVITGKTEPGAEVIVKDKDGNVIGSTTADPEGNYEIEVPALDKDEVVDVTATDGAGNESDPTEVIGTGDDIAPNAPTVDDVTNVDEDGDGTPDKTVITGKTEPGAEVIVKDKDGNVIGSTTADPEGNYEIEVPALDKDEVVDVTATDKAGNESDPTEVIGTGDDIAPNAPTVDDVTNVDEDGDGTPDKTVITGKTEPGAEIIVKDKDGNVIGSTTADPEGNYEIEVPALDKDEVVDVTATDKAGNESDPTEVIGTGDDIAPNAPTVDDVTNVDEDGDGTPDKTVITGKTEPGAEIIVKDKDGNVIGSTTADPEGNYEIEVPALDKDEVVDVTATDGAGNESDPTEVIGTGDDIAPNAPTVDDVTNVDEDGDGTPDKTVITGKTEPGAEIIVKDKDGNVIGSTTADPEGNYEIEVPALDKDEVVDVTATDKAGNESDPTEVIGTGDDIAPNAPTVDDVTNVDEDGDGTPDKTVITGKTEPGAEIIVKDKDGNVIGSTTADPEGNYEIEVPALDKDEVVDVTATDKAGNESDPTEVIGTGDDIAPNAPTVDDVTNVDEDGDGTPDKTVITGKTEPGAEVIVKDKDGNVIGSTTADPEGNYEIEVPALDKDEVVDVTATDKAGNESDPTEVIGTGDDIAPNAPTVDDVTNVDEDGDGTPDKTVITGKTEPGAEIIVKDKDGNVIGSTTADPEGNYEIEVPALDKDEVVDVTATDGAGNESDPTEVIGTGDDIAPNAPTVDDVTNVDEDGDGTPDKTVITGKTEPGAEIIVKDKDGNVIGSTTADPEGNYEIEVPALDKDEVVDVTATDGAGNESDPTEVIGTGDDIAPNAPTVDDVTNVDEDGDGTPDKTVITGKTEPGAEIIVKDKDGNVIGSTTADPEGNYEIEVPALDKDEVVDVTATDGAGNESDPTEVIGTGDDIAPNAPTVDDVTNVDEDGDGTPDKTVITGKTEPGAEVIVKDKDGNVIGSTTADPEGNYEIEVPALDKDEVVDVTATDGAGNESDPTEVIGTGDDIAPNAPTVDDVTNVDEDGDGTPDKTVITGKTEPGAEVIVKDKDGNVIGSTTADPEGNYEIEVPALDKDEVVDVTATDGAGNESDPTEVIGTGDDIAPNAPTVDDVTNVDEDGDGTPDKTVITGKTEPGAEVIVKDKDGNVIGSTTADPEGNYEIEVPALDKDEVVDVTATDGAGNESDPTEVIGTGDDIAPNAPTVDDVTNVDEDGDGTPDKTVITGKTEPGAEIIVKDKDGNVIGSTTADPEGNYEIEVPALDKDEVVDVTATDGAGNESDPTEVIGTGDDIAPNAPTVDDVTNVDEDGDGTPDKTVITGKTEPGAEVIVKDKDGNVIGSTTADPEGNYEIEVPALDKDEVVDVTATDGAGNESDPTEVIGTGDDIAPNAPTVDDVTNVDEDGDGTPDKTVITGKTEPGAEIIVKDKDGNVIGSTTADPEGNYEIEVPALDKDEVVDVTATDGAGNESDPTEVIGTGDDIAPNAPTVDDVTNVDEDGDGTPDKTVITGKTEPGAEVIVKDKDGNVIGSTTADPEGNYEIEVPALDKDEVVDVTATDGAGNESDPTEVIGTGDDIAPNAPTVDDVTNVDEDGDGTPDKTVITGKTEPGAEVIVKDKDGNVIGSTTADPEGNYEIEVPALDKDEVVDVTATDKAGNESDPTEVIGKGDNIPPNSDTTTITIDDVTEDNVINATEAGGKVNVTGTVAGEFTVGDKVTLTINEKQFTGNVVAGGKFTIAVDGVDLAKDADKTIEGSVIATDKAGNTGTIKATKVYGVDTDGPSDSGDNPTTLVIDDVTEDNVINATEAGGKVNVTGTVAGEFTVGDKVTLTINEKQFTGNVVAGGKFTIAVDGVDLAKDADKTIEGSVIATDKAGNTGTIKATKVYGVDTDGPSDSGDNPTTLVIDDVTEDNVINATEAGGKVNVTGTVAGEFTVGDKVTLTINEKQFTGNVVAGGKFTIAVDGVDLAKDADKTIEGTVIATDKAGNTGTIKATKAYGVDTDVPGDTDGDGIADVGPTVVIADGNDGQIDRADLNDDGTVTATITFPADAGFNVGDTVTITTPDGESKVELTAENLAGGIEVTFTPKAEGENNVVTAVVTDPQGSKSEEGRDESVTDLIVPGDTDEDGIADVGPTVVIADGNDGQIDRADLNDDGTVTATITFPADAGFNVGDTVTITTPDGESKVELTAENLAGGIEVTFTPKAEGENNVVTAVVTDPQGSKSEEGRDESVTDLIVPGDTDEDGIADVGPTVVIADGNDGQIDRADLNDDGTVTATITFPADAGFNVGDTVTITTPDGESKVELTAENLAGGIEVTFTPKAEGENNVVTAVVTDPQGSKSEEGRDESVTDLIVPGDTDEDGIADVGPTVVIADGNDGQIDRADLNDDGTVTAKITFPADAGFNVGDTVTITTPDGESKVELTAENLAGGIEVTFTPKAEGENNVVTAVVTDPQGSKSEEGRDESVTDLIVPGDTDEDGIADVGPTVVIADGNDGQIDRADLNDDGTVTATITFPADAGFNVGDTVTITTPDGESKVELTAENLAGGIEVTFTPKAEGENNVVTAVVTDPQGSKSEEGRDESVTDLIVPGDTDEDGIADVGPTVVIADGNDGQIDRADLNDDGTVTAKITFPADAGFNVGDTVTITTPDGESKVELTAENLAGGIEVTFTPKAEGENNVVTAVVTDPQGSKSEEGRDESVTDLIVPGDTDEDGIADVGPTVVIADGNDGQIDRADLNEDGTVTATITFPADAGFNVGDTVTITTPDGESKVELTAENLAGGIEVTFTPKAEGENNVVTAVVTEPQGSKSEEGRDESVTDLIVPGDTDEDGIADVGPTVVIADGNDGQIDRADLNDDGTVTATITFPADAGFNVGDTVTITTPDGESKVELTAENLAGGIEVTFTPKAEGENNVVTAVVTDPQGSKSEEGRDESVTDLIVPGDTDEDGIADVGPTVVIADGNDGQIDRADLNDDGTVTATITFPADAGFNVGDTVTITTPDGESKVELTAENLAGGIEVTFTPKAEGENNVVTAVVTDPQGSKSEEGRDESVTDLIVPGDTDEDGIADVGPTVVIADGNDGQIDRADLNDDGTVTATITFPADAGFNVGDTVTITTPDGESKVELTAENLAGGIEVTFTPKAEGENNVVTAVVTDPQGSKSEEGRDESVTDLIVPGDTDEDGIADVGPTVVIADGNDGQIDRADLNEDGTVTATITFPADAGFNVGDTVTITTPDGESKVELTAENLAGGIEVTFTPKAEGENNVVTAVVTDPQGSKSEEGRDESVTDLIVPGDTDEDGIADVGPTVVIADGNDGQIDRADLNDDGTVTATITFPADAGFNVGDTVTITTPDGESKVELTAENLAGGIEVTFTPKAEGENNVVTAVVTDPQGSKSEEGRDESVTDLIVPGDTDEDGIADVGPTVVIADGNDGQIDRADLNDDGTVTAKITFPADAGFNVGDTVTITTPDGESKVELTAENLAGGIEVTFTPKAEGENNVVTAVVTDPQGSKSEEGRDESVTDLIVPGDTDEDGIADVGPTVVIADGNDGQIDRADLNDDGTVTATITFPADAGFNVGDTVMITTPDGESKVELTAENLAGGIEVTFTPKAEGENNVVTAVVTDPQGSKSEEGRDESVTDLIVPGDTDEDGIADVGPTVVIADGNDGQIDRADLNDDGTVTATITFPADAGFNVGDTVTITTPDGESKVELTAENLAGGIEVTFTPKAEGENNVVTAVVTDPQGSKSEEGRDESVTDLIVPGDTDEDGIADVGPTVVIADGNDGQIDRADLNDDGTVTAKITFPADAGFNVGDTVMITTPDGESKVELTAENLAGGIEVTFTPKAEGENNVVTAVVTDPQGSKSEEGRDESVTDLIVPGDTDEDGIADVGPTVVIADGNDGQIDRADLNDDGTVTATITFPADAGFNVGDTVTITTPDGESKVELTAENLAGGIEVTFTPKAEGENNVVTAVVTDPQGSKSEEGRDESVTDLIVPGDTDEDGIADVGPTVVIADGNDGQIDRADLNDDGTVTATITFPADAGFNVGDTVTITTPDGESKVELTAENLAGGIEVTFTPKAEGENNVVTAVVTDPQGSKSEEGRDESVTDLIVPGDTDEDGIADVGPTVVIADGNDGQIDRADLNDDGTVTATITFPADAGFNVGDTVMITTPDGESKVELTAENLAGGIEVTFTPKAEGENNVVTAVVTDPQGSKSEEGRDESVTDLIVPGDTDEDGIADVGPTVVIADGNDGQIDRADLNDDGTVTATITFPADAGFNVGDTVTITTPDGESKVELTAENLAGGIEVTFTPKAEGENNVVTAVVTDPQGSKSEEGRDESVTDLIVPGDTDEDGIADVGPTVVIADGNDGQIDRADLNDDGTVTATITFPADAGFNVGDTVTITTPDGESKVELTAENLAGGIEVTFTPKAEGENNVVTAVVTDPQGSKSEEGRDESVTDLIVPGDTDEDGIADVGPTVVIADGNDGQIDRADLNDDGTVTATITFPADAGFNVGDTVTITTPDGESKVELTAENLAGGIEVTFTPKAEGENNVVTAVVTDPQGSKSEEGRDESVTDLIVPGDTDEDGIADVGPTVVIADGNDGQIDRADLNDDGTVTATITFPADAGFNVGDVVTITTPDGTSKVELTAENLAGGIEVTFTPKAEGENNVVTAVVTDPQGSESKEGRDESVTDLIVPGDTDEDGIADVGPTVVIADGNDGFINVSDVVEGETTIETRITFQSNAGYRVGDSIIITDQTGTELVNRLLTQEDLDKGIIVNAMLADEGDEVVVNATVSDNEGNSITGQDKSLVDTIIANVKEVTIDLDSNNDKLISATEKGDATSTNVTVTLDDAVQVDDIVTLTSSTGQVIESITVTESMIASKEVTFTGITLPADGQTLEVTATIKDVAGNVGDSATDSATINPATAPKTESFKIDLKEDGNTTQGNLNRPEIKIEAAQLNGKSPEQIQLQIDGKSVASFYRINDDRSVTFFPKEALDNGTHTLALVGGTEAVTLDAIVNVGHTFSEGDFVYSDINNDPITGVEITSLPVNGNLYLNGQLITAPQEISIQDIRANSLLYVPAKDKSDNDVIGSFEEIGFKVVNGAESEQKSEERTITIKVEPVSDGTFTKVIDTALTDELIISSLDGKGGEGFYREYQNPGLNFDKYSQDRISYIGGFNKPKNIDFLKGAIETTLLPIVETVSIKNAPLSLGTTGMVQTTQLLGNNSNGTYGVNASADDRVSLIVKFEGLIYLEAGKTYNFKSSGTDDSVVINLGGDTVFEQNAAGNLNKTYTAKESGFYTLDMYHLNTGRQGKLDISIDGKTLNTDNFLVYKDKAALEDALSKADNLKGFGISSLQGSTDGRNGYYTIEGNNVGEAGTWIKISDLSKIEVQPVASTDSNETVVKNGAVVQLEVAGLPNGYKITDGAKTEDFSDVNTTVDITSWNRANIQVFVPLTAKAGREGIELITSSQDGTGEVTRSSTHLHINISKDSANYSGTEGGDKIILGTPDKPGTGDNVLFGGSGDDKLDGGAGNDVLFGDSAGGVRGGSFEYWDFSEFKGTIERANNKDYAYLVADSKGETDQVTIGAWNVGGRKDDYSLSRDYNNLEFANPNKGTTSGSANKYDAADAGSWVLDMEARGLNELDIWQNVTTMPGEKYHIEMIISDKGDTAMQLQWGGHTIGILQKDQTNMVNLSGVEVSRETSGLPSGYSKYILTVAGDREAEFTELRILGHSTDGGGGRENGRILASVDLKPVGASGDDTLIGGEGNDILYGQGGKDILWGGKFVEEGGIRGDGSTDTFVYSFNKNNGADIIKDFEVGIDRIYLTDVLDAYNGLGMGKGTTTTVTYSETDAKAKHITRTPGTKDDVDSNGNDIPNSTVKSDDNLTIKDFRYDNDDGDSLNAQGQYHQYITVEGSEGTSGDVVINFGSGKITDAGAKTAFGSVTLEGVKFGIDGNTDTTTYGSVEELFGYNGHQQILWATTDGFQIPKDNNYANLTNIDMTVTDLKIDGYYPVI